MPIWEAPGALFLGLSIPAILLLYLLRRQRPRRRVSSLLLWPPLAPDRQANAPWQRLRPRLVLWLQLLAAALLTLAAARPLWAGGAGAGGVHRIVILDASGSMRAADGQPTRFAAALAAALELAQERSPRDRISLIRMDERPRVLLAEATGAEAVAAALQDQEPGYGGADLEAALALAAALSGETGAAEWVVVTDGGVAVPPTLDRRPGIALRSITVGEHGANVALTGLTLRESGDRLLAQVGVVNLGDRPVSGSVTLVGLPAAATMGTHPFSLEPGGQLFLTWPQLAPAPGYRAELAGVEPQANLLPQDDQAWAVSPRPPRPRVLLVSPGGGFLESALLAHGGLAVERVQPEDYRLAPLNRYDLVVFDQVRPEAWPPGGALVVGPPAGTGPVAPGTVTVTPGPGTPAPGAAEHPVLRHVVWDEVHVARSLALELAAGWQPLLLAPGPAGAAAGAAVAEVEGEVDGEAVGGATAAGDGTPAGTAATGSVPLLAVQETPAARRAVLAFRLQDSDLPLRTAFPVLMANLVDWLAPQPPALAGSFQPGSLLTLPPLPLAEALYLEHPDGRRQDLAPPWPPARVRLPRPGLYQLVQVRGDGSQLSSPLAVSGYQPLESRVEPQSHPALTAATAGTAPTSPQPLWPWLAAAVLILSFLEWWVDARGL